MPKCTNIKIKKHREKKLVGSMKHLLRVGGTGANKENVELHLGSMGSEKGLKEVKRFRAR